jgi:hypothetical protein
MSLEKQIVIDKIEIAENGAVHVRQATKILEDGKELSSSYHRWVVTPGEDLTGQDPRVVAVANAVWTPDVISAYKLQTTPSNG